MTDEATLKYRKDRLAREQRKAQEQMKKEVMDK